jgi:peptide/nickel transport system permease protein/oligopeptide transport system permease protein
VLTYVARRVLVAIPTIFGVATVIFLLVRLLPGDPARTIAGVLASPEDVDRIRTQFGLDQPLYVQYVTYIVHLLTGDLGISTRTGSPVREEILTRLPYTMELAAISTAISILLGVTLGVIAATRRGSPLDLLISAVAVFGLSMPVYWLGLMLIILFSIQLHVFPAAGAQDPLGFVLPSITLAMFSLALVARQARSAMLEVLGQDYVRTARAKGAPMRTVLVKHALRNALLPVMTVIGLQFGALIGGAVLTETVFSWPGVGRLLVDSIFSRDYPVVQGVVLMLAFGFILVNLLVDLLYAYVDPRIRYS